MTIFVVFQVFSSFLWTYTQWFKISIRYIVTVSLSIAFGSWYFNFLNENFTFAKEKNKDWVIRQWDDSHGCKNNLNFSISMTYRWLQVARFCSAVLHCISSILQPYIFKICICVVLTIINFTQVKIYSNIVVKRVSFRYILIFGIYNKKRKGDLPFEKSVDINYASMSGLVRLIWCWWHRLITVYSY